MAYKKRSAVGYMWRKQAWVFAVLVLAGLGLGAIKTADYQLASRFDAEGVEVIGAVSHMNDYANRNRETYRISYTFDTPDDRYNSGLQDVSETFYDAQAVGGPITVWYLPTDPTVNIVEPTKLSSGFWVTMIAAAGLVFSGFIGAYFATVRARACVQLRETGKVTTATVSAHAVEGKKKRKARIEWRDSTGITGSSLSMPVAQLPAIGSTVTIFSDQHGRQNPVWEGDIGSR